MVVLDKNLGVMRLEIYHKLTLQVHICSFYKSRLDLSEKLEMLTSSVFVQIMASQTTKK